MVRARTHLPAGHGELLARPEMSAWGFLLKENRRLAEASRDAFIGPARLGAMRSLARAEALALAARFSERLGVAVARPGDPEGYVIATGHQPELYHPGVWVKDFLLQRFAEEAEATALDVVVDSDGFDSVRITSPCWRPQIQRCVEYLAVGTADGYYAGASVPDAAALEAFCATGEQQLSSLPAPNVRRHFEQFCEVLLSAADDASNLSELVTFARRRYEASARTDYLELPVTSLASGEAFTLFCAALALDAERFASVYNQELAAYRAVNRTRSAAQPFPDLERRGDAVELPFWHLDGRRRRSVFAALRDEGVALLIDGEQWIVLSPDLEAAAESIRAASGVLAPKALALTMFVRLCCCDLFIHGVGGARYDAVTDGVIREYVGIVPPAFVVASLTMYLPLGAHLVSDEEIAAANERANRFEHNPDQLLAEVEFDDAGERGRALALSDEKRRLLEEIAKPGADKKALGQQIRAVNDSLASLLAPFGEELKRELSRLEEERAASDILTDRGYPFCFWSPGEVADKIV